MKRNAINALPRVVHTSNAVAVLLVMFISLMAPIVLRGTAAAEVTAPSNLRFTGPQGTNYKCEYHSNNNQITPTWDAALLAESYNYKFTQPNGELYGPVNVGNVTSVNETLNDEGTSNFTVQAVYADGGTSVWAPACNVTYDITKPVITSNISPGMSLKGTVTITETVAEPNPLAYNIRILDTEGNPVSVNGKNLGAYENPAEGNSLDYTWVTTDVPDRAYKLQFSARDIAGNTETLVFNVSVDNTTPGVEIDPYPSPVSDSTPTISGNVNDDNTNVQVTVGGTTYPATPSAGRWSITTDFLADGTYDISAVATDAAGNATTPPASGTITIDTTPPNAVITTPTNGSTVHGFIQISGTVADAASYTLSINSDTVLSNVSGNFTYTWDTTELPSGTYKIALSASDSASNTAEDTVMVTVDNTAPAIPTQISPANNSVGTGGAINALSWAASEDSSGPVDYRVEVASDPGFGNIESSGSIPSTAYGLDAMTDGTHYWRVQACDRFGNCSGWSNAWTFTVDNTAPVVTVDDSDTKDTTPLIKGTVNDPSAVVTVRVSGITYAATVSAAPNGSGTYDWTANVTQKLSYGPHSLTIFARDSLGNNSVQSGAITIIGTSAETNDAISRLATGGSILGNSGQTGVVTDAAVTDTKDQAKTSAQNNGSKFLGLGWWWLPLLALLLGTTYYGYTYKNSRG